MSARTIARCLLLTGASACACSGGEVVLEAVLSDDSPGNGCAAFGWSIASIAVAVIEWHPATEVSLLDYECLEVAPEDRAALVDAQSLIDSFRERGFIATDIPAGTPTRVYMIAFPTAGCRGAIPMVCGGTSETLSDTTFDESQLVPMAFVCAAFEYTEECSERPTAMACQVNREDFSDCYPWLDRPPPVP